MLTARRVVVGLVTSLFLVSISSHLTWAAGGSGGLDHTFGVRGKVLTDFGGGSFESAQALAIQSDGKILVAGRSSVSGILARYNSRGRLDRQFGAQGKVLTDLGVQALAIQSDGKIVVAGASDASGTADFAVARYNPDGTLDSTFNGTGKVLTDFGGPGSSAQAVAIQSDGKIVAAGLSFTSGGYAEFALARYNPDGTLDATFNGTGKVLTNFGGETESAAHALAIQSDGKIVAAGYFNVPAGGTADFALARYNPDGTLDATFNATGKVITDFSGPPNGHDFAYALAIQSDGKLVAAGSSIVSNEDDAFALARYNPDGTLDATFNGTGKVLTNFVSGFGNADIAYALAIQSDGKLVAAGSSFAPEPSYDFALARYNPDGTLDATFNATGKVITDFSGSGSYDEARALAIQSDGKLVAGGISTARGTADFALARYFP
jgi:uncharacterized delta-60 repeat protein